jgi:hypothetical protein
MYVDAATGLWTDLLGVTGGEPVADFFIAGLTKPVCADPLNPTAADNVGWDGDSSGGTFGDPTQNTKVILTIPANTTWSNRIIYANVQFTNATSKMVNCIVFGAAFSGDRLGLVLVPSGGNMERCTVYGMPKSVSYYTNGVRVTGGVLTTKRCVFMRTIDAVRISAGGSTARWIDEASYGDRFAFFDNDADHANDAVRPYWTHNDFFQATIAATAQHSMFGSRVEAFFDTTGVVWSGGSPGVGTASGGSIGMPSTALNAGFKDELGRGTWCNGVTLSNVSGHKIKIDSIWINGVNAGSGMVQFTVSSSTNPNQLVLLRSRFALGGVPSGSGKFYCVTYASSTLATIGTGADANIFDDSFDVPSNLRGTAMPFTATGSSIIP